MRWVRDYRPVLKTGCDLVKNRIVEKGGMEMGVKIEKEEEVKEKGIRPKDDDSRRRFSVVLLDRGRWRVAVLVEDSMNVKLSPKEGIRNHPFFVSQQSLEGPEQQ